MSIAIGGGLYFESCVEPEHCRLLGSAGRAAASISKRGSAITVYSAVANRDLAEAENLAEEFEFDLCCIPSEFTVRFDYVHSMSVPRIRPDYSECSQELKIAVNSEYVLRFGMMEATVVANAKRAVYDPQSAFTPERFGDNGSRAEELFIVANGYEARRLTGLDELEQVALALLDIEGTVAVVLKDGVNGCIVSRKHAEPVRLPVIPTHRVFKIGSGDVFSANLAYAWLVGGADPVEAAGVASKATAHYVSQRYLPTPDQANCQFLDDLLLPNIEKLGDVRSVPYHIYLAGPFFNLPQRWLIEEALANLLEMKLKVFSPLHEVGRGPGEVVAKADLEGLRESRIVLAMLDGLDAGTLYEIGYARALNIPVLHYTRNVTEESLKMMVGSQCLGFDDFASSLYAASWYARHSL